MSGRDAESDGESVVDFGPPAGDVAPAALEAARERYRRNGYFLARNLVDPTGLERVRQDIRRLIGLQLARAGRPVPDETVDFDAGLATLNAIDRELGGLVYRACRRLASIHQLSVDARLLGLSRALMSTDLVSISSLASVRIDNPGEDRYLFAWHQDYPYIQDSLDGVVFWMPLIDTDARNGALRILPGSHVDGLRKVRIVDSSNQQRNGAHTVALVDAPDASDARIRTMPTRTGEVLVFSTLLLHASGTNQTRRTRWTVQIRHGNFRDAFALDRGWPGGMIEGASFEKHHPDFSVT